MPPADATRQRLLRAAIELFTTQGYHDTTTPLIARRAGVAEGTIYRHFSGKQDLLNELYRGALRWATGQVETARADGVAVREQLARLARGLAACAVHDPAVIRMGFLQRHGDLLDDRSREMARELRGAIERLVARGKSDGTVRVGSAEQWAGVWLAVVVHALDRLCGRAWSEDATAVEQCIAAAWTAIAAPATSTSAPAARPPHAPSH